VKKITNGDLRQCDQFHDSKYAREFFGKKRDALWLLKEGR
jgi:hypothetical protein